MSDETNELTYVESIYAGRFYACFIPANKNVLNVKLNVDVTKSSVVPSSSSG